MATKKQAAASKHAGRRYWLFKSEPEAYGFEQFQRDGRTFWHGVRNYEARNLLRDAIQVGDGVLFYHSSCAEPGIAGLAEVASAAYPDPTQFDRKSPYYDPKAAPDAPRWFGVEIVPVAAMRVPVTREMLKLEPALGAMMVLQRGARLSVQPVDPEHFARVCSMGGVAAR